MSLSRIIYFLLFFSVSSLLLGQGDPRDNYDVSFYDLEVQLAPDLERIAGKNLIRFKAKKAIDSLRIDIHPNLKIAKVSHNGTKVKFTNLKEQINIKLPRRLLRGETDEVEILFSGDLKARNEWRPIWAKDQSGKTLVAITNQEVDPHAWWPVKNASEDMADSMRLTVIYPDNSTIIANGQKIRRTTLPGGFQKWTFHSPFPTPPHQVGFHIGDFVSVSDVYVNESGEHPIEIFTPRSQFEKSAKKVKKIKNYFTFLEKYYGPYPYWGNGFQWFDLPSALQGESQPSEDNPSRNDVEDDDQVLYRQLFLNWFGKSFILESPEDRWLFEALTIYTEALFVEYQSNEDLAHKYLLNQRKGMGAPVLYMDSNLENYQLKKQIGIKGAWFFHTIRESLDNDKLWFQIFKAFIIDNQHKGINTDDFYTYMSWKLNEEYDIIFDQFLKYRKLPVFHYRTKKKGNKLTFSYRWESESEHFDLPIIISIRDIGEQLAPTSDWQSFTRKGIKDHHIKIASDGLFDIVKDK